MLMLELLLLLLRPYRFDNIVLCEAAIVVLVVIVVVPAVRHEGGMASTVAVGRTIRSHYSRNVVLVVVTVLLLVLVAGLW